MNLDNLINILPGWKTKLTIIIGAVMVVLTQAFQVTIPEYVFQLLGLFGLYSARVGMDNAAQAAAQSVVSQLNKE